MSKTEVPNEDSSKIREAENGWMKAKKSIDDAFYELGKAYFEAQDNFTHKNLYDFLLEAY